MSGLEGLFAIFVVAFMPVALVFITRYYALKEKELAARTDGDPRVLSQLVEETRQLAARVETLETIVASGDYELHERLLRLPDPTRSTRSDALAARHPRARLRPSPTRPSPSRPLGPPRSPHRRVTVPAIDGDAALVRREPDAPRSPTLVLVTEIAPA